MRPEWLRAIGIALFLLAAVQPVFAQDEVPGRIAISPPDASNFPLIRLNMEIYDAQGMFVPDLDAGDLQVLEDGQPRAVAQLEVTQPGLQVIAAFAPTAFFGTKVGGSSLFESVKEALTAWAQSQPEDTPDEFSIATSTGMQALRLKNPAEWALALQSYLPDLATAQPSLVSLSQAMDLAADPTNGTGRRQVVFYITPLPQPTNAPALEGMIDLAVNLGVQVNVLMLATGTQGTSPAAEPLIRMADLTGGEFFVYTGVEDLPDFEGYLQPLRYVYQLAYVSGLNESGDHDIQVEVKRADVPLTSGAEKVNLTILPTNPMFLSPPAILNRTWTEPESLAEDPVLQPDEQIIQILVEYPDGHARNLASSTLYANGQMVAQNDAPPFDSFTWPLVDYTANTHVLLQVEVVDNLGLMSRSIEAPVDIVVEIPPKRFLGGVVTRERVLIAAGILVVAAILLALLIRSLRRKRKQLRRKVIDPLTQPVRIRQERNLQASPVTVAPVPPPTRISAVISPARLIPLSDTGMALKDSAIPVGQSEIIFGSDPNQATKVLHSSSIGSAHARLAYSPEGKYILADLGSVAGTWVNFMIVTRQGVTLEHGDLVNLGRLPFRFELSEPDTIKRPTISSYQEDEP